MKHVKYWILALLMGLFLFPKIAFGQTQGIQSGEVEETRTSGPLQLTLSVVPGVLVHGSGQLIAGDTSLGLKLLAAQGVGILGLGGGIAMLAITGASDQFNVPVIWTMSLGGAAFIFSWFGDIYASMGASQLTGRPKSLPLMEISQGIQFVYNPILDDGFYSKTSLRLAAKKWLASASISIRPDLNDIRSQLRGQYRLVGSARNSEEFFTLGDSLDLSLGYDLHTYDDRRVVSHQFPLALLGRLDLRNLDKALRGSFVDASIGLVFGGYFYDSGTVEYAEQLIADIGFGVYLGRRKNQWGTAKLYYRHRHDGFLGGAKLIGLGSGATGSANFRLRHSLFDDWGFEIGAGAGSAYVFDLSAIYRWGK